MSTVPDLEEQKKVILPFMQRAQEMQTADPKVAYYCRMYAVEQAFKFEKRAKEISGLVSAALAQMEKEKPRLGLDKDNDRYHCEALALKVFSNADKVDRAGRADLGTAKTFLAASYFLEILNHFGPLDGDLLEKQRYAAWRAAEIRKAVREGRPALPPSGATAPTDQAPGNGSGAGFGTGRGGVDDLPAAYSSGASGGAGSGSALDALPPAYGSAGSGGSFRGGPGGYPAPPAPTPLQQQPTPLQQTWSDSLPSVPAPPEPFAPAPPSFMAPTGGIPTPAPAPLPSQRFKPGSRLLYKPEGAPEPEQGTVGQVLPGLDGSCQYRVALRERLEVIHDDGRCLAPDVAPGDSVVFMGRGGPAPATVVLVNDDAWPPSYVVQLPDGGEMAAAAHEVSLVEPWNAVKPSGSTMPPAPDMTASHSAPSVPAYPTVGPTYSAPPPPPVQPPQPGHAAPPPHHGSHHAPARPWTEPMHAQPAPPPPAAAPVSLPPGHKPSVQAILEAQKNAKYAVSSLNFEDVPAAVKYLQNALRALTQA